MESWGRDVSEWLWWTWYYRVFVGLMVRSIYDDDARTLAVKAGVSFAKPDMMTDCCEDVRAGVFLVMRGVFGENTVRNSKQRRMYTFMYVVGYYILYTTLHYTSTSPVH